MSETERLITGIDVELYSIELPRKLLDASHGARSYEFVIAHVIADGVTGSGFTYFTGKGGAAAAALICDVVAPAVVGQPLDAVRANWALGQRALNQSGWGAGSPLALAAVDVGWWDALARSQGVPLYRLMGGSQRKVPTYCSGPDLMLDPQQLARDLMHRRDLGYGAFKINMGLDLARDVERLAAARDAVGDEAPLFVDASRSWTLFDAIQHLPHLADAGIAFIEEPFHPSDAESYRRLKQHSRIALAGGETLRTGADFVRLLAAGSVDIVQPDICRLGGFTEWLRVLALAELHIVPVMTHYTLELAVHAAAVGSAVRYVERNDHNLTDMGVAHGAVQQGDGWVAPCPEPGHGIIFTFSKRQFVRRQEWRG